MNPICIPTDGDYIGAELIARGFEVQTSVCCALATIYKRGNIFCMVQDWTSCQRYYGHQIDLYYITSIDDFNSATWPIDQEYFAHHHKAIMPDDVAHLSVEASDFYQSLGNIVDAAADELLSRFGEGGAV